MGGSMEYIYCIKNKINGKLYIGKTKRPNKRLTEHKMLVGKKRHKLYDAILHYGWDNFEFIILNQTTSDKINDLEVQYIEQYDTVLNGYNYTIGGTGGDTFTNKCDELKEITRKKLSETAKKNLTDDYRKKMSDLTRKKWENEDYRIKVLNGLKKVVNTKEYKDKLSMGVKKSLEDPEKRKLWSEVKSGNKNGRWLGYIIVYDNNGVEYGRYESAVEVNKQLGIPAHTVRVKAKNGEPYKCVKKGKNYYMFTFKLVVENKKENI
jgi:group I intron endonuclease